jgi:hypothetical protein
MPAAVTGFRERIFAYHDVERIWGVKRDMGMRGICGKNARRVYGEFWRLPEPAYSFAQASAIQAPRR